MVCVHQLSGILKHIYAVSNPPLAWKIKNIDIIYLQMVGKIALFLNILELSEASALSRSTVYNTEEKYTSFNRLSPSDDSNTATHS